jgi:hypothetical protein
MKFPTTRRLLLPVVAIALLLAACGGTSDGEVRPFSEIQDSEFIFENDPGFPDRGIFRVVTTEPSICSIAWGPTEALGNQNNSLAMNGTGIIDHDVLLPGAEAGATYFFRVQGATADGQLFQSELSTFTLPAAEAAGDDGDMEDAAHGENLALGATIVEVSSEFSSDWAAENAIDDDLATEWATAGSGDDAFLTIDLGSSQEVVGVEFLTRSMADGSAIANDYFVIVDDGDRLGPFPAGNPANPEFAAVSFNGKIIRFEIDSSTGGNTGAIEVRVFAPSTASGMDDG